MSYGKYKVILVVFACLFVLLAILYHYLNPQNITELVVGFTSGLLLLLLLFFFLLYARGKVINDDTLRFTPFKLFPAIAYGLIFAAIAYPISMAVTYKIGQSFTDKFIQWENVSVGLKNTAYNNKSAASRLDAATRHYIYFGDQINYLDEKNQNKQYSPDKYATIERMKFIKTEDNSRSLKMFMLFSSIISLITGIIVISIYLRYRKDDKLLILPVASNNV